MAQPRWASLVRLASPWRLLLNLPKPIAVIGGGGEGIGVGAGAALAST